MRGVRYLPNWSTTFPHFTSPLISASPFDTSPLTYCPFPLLSPPVLCVFPVLPASPWVSEWRHPFWCMTVTPSTVVSTSLSLDLQFPFALLYCFCLCNSDPLLCTRYNSVPFISYKYLYSVPRSLELRLLLLSPISSFTLPLLLEILKISLPLTYLSPLLVTHFW